MPGLREYGRGSREAAVAVQFLKMIYADSGPPLAAVRIRCTLPYAQTANYGPVSAFPQRIPG